MTDFNKRLGGRIGKLRNMAGVSQEKLATQMNLNRSAITQIEAGDRRISTEELVKFAQFFNLTTDQLLDPKYEPEVVLEDTEEKQKTVGIRINVPQKNVKKFKEVLLYILERVGSKPNIGETVIYKLLYFMDFNFYEKYEEQLIGATYTKNKYGPTPNEFLKIVEKMIENEEIEKIKSKHYEYPQTKYIPIKEANLSIFNANEIRVIDDVLNKLSDMNATQISEYSHGDVPWITTEDGQIIDYESVFYRTAPYSVRSYDEIN